MSKKMWIVDEDLIADFLSNFVGDDVQLVDTGDTLDIVPEGNEDCPYVIAKQATSIDPVRDVKDELLSSFLQCEKKELVLFKQAGAEAEQSVQYLSGLRRNMGVTDISLKLADILADLNSRIGRELKGCVQRRVEEYNKKVTAGRDEASLRMTKDWLNAKTSLKLLKCLNPVKAGDVVLQMGQSNLFQLVVRNEAEVYALYLDNELQNLGRRFGCEVVYQFD